MKKFITSEMAPQEKSVSVYYILVFLICFISTAFGGAVSTLMSVYLPVVLKDLSVHNVFGSENDVGGYINAIFIFGWAIGGFTWGMISDKMGRKKSLLGSVAFYGVFTILTGLSEDWFSMTTYRFFSGFGVGGVLVVSLITISEVWPQRSKAIYIGILSIAFPVGIFSAGLINYLVSDWRSGFFVGVIPLFISIIGAFLLKESPVWQNEKSKGKALATSVFSKGNRRSLVFGSVIFGSMLIGLWAIFSWLPTWVQSIVTNSDGQKERGLSMMFLGMGGLTGGFLSGWLVNFLGMRKSMFICFSVCATISFVLFKTNFVFTNIVYLEIAILALFFGGSQGVLSVYIPGLFPTAVRAAATGFCFNLGRIFTAIAVLFIALLVTTLGGYGNAIFIFSLVFIIGLITIIFAGSSIERNKNETAEMPSITVIAEAS